MKDEVPLPIMDAHVKTVIAESRNGKNVDPTFGLEKSGTARGGKPLLFRHIKGGWSLITHRYVVAVVNLIWSRYLKDCKMMFH